ncbi:MAG: 8-amino-7-oxononanoate synthase [Candidatus Omnitrophota bacterium]
MPEEYFKNYLAQLESQGLLRSLREVSSAQEETIIIDGKKVLNLCSNNYLGLANDRRLKQAAVAAIKKYGVGAGASRLVCGNSRLHRELEERLAAFKGAQKCLVYTSGYAANLGILSAIVGRDDLVFADRLNHASLNDGVILSRAEFKRYPHKDIAALEEMLKKAEGKRKLIVTDTVFSMDGDVAPLPEIVSLAKKYSAMVMVDEAHAFGVLGKSGKGALEHFNLEKEIAIQMGTLSKAVGALGAYVCADEPRIDFLINRSRGFIYTTALPPGLCAAAMAAVKIIEKDYGLRQRLLENADFLRRELQDIGFDTGASQTPIIPVITKDDKLTMEFSRRLFRAGIFVPGIRPPTVPPGEARLRITVMATHKKNELERALAAFKKIGQDLGII